MVRAIYLFAIAALGLMAAGSTAQNFSYSLSPSFSAYVPLTDPALVTNGSNWTNSQRFKLPIGFGFTFLGQNFDTLYIETNGFIVFDRGRNYTLATFKGAQCKQDTNDAWSSISYSLSGDNGSRILKIQFTNLGFFDHHPAELFSYQVWLYEQSGTIEFHTGPNSNQLYTDQSTPTLLGLINAHQDTGTKAFLATGEPGSPSGSMLSQNDELLYLSTVPAEGKVFVFSIND